MGLLIQLRLTKLEMEEGKTVVENYCKMLNATRRSKEAGN
jgi:hypothetical protein